jgi:hypothetical protein
MKIESQKIIAQRWADITARGPALLDWPSRPTPASVAHALSAVTVRWPRARRRGGKTDVTSPAA